MDPYETQGFDGNGSVTFSVIPGRRYTGMIHGSFGGGTVSISEKLPEVSGDSVVVSTHTAMAKFDIVTAGNQLIFTMAGATGGEIFVLVVPCPLGV